MRRKPSKRTRTSALVPFSFAWPKPKIPFLASLACLGDNLLLDHTETLFTQSRVGHYCAPFYYQILPRKSLSAPIGVLIGVLNSRDYSGDYSYLNLSMLSDAVTVIWASPRFGHPHSHIPSVLGIPGGGCPKR